MLVALAIYGGVGAVAGVLAGLLGVGGGVVIVPMLVFSFKLLDIPLVVMMHLALGTSLASIIFTSISSFMAHHRRGAVYWLVVRRIVIGIMTGTFIGTCFVATLSTPILKIVFVIFLYTVAAQFLLDKKPTPGRELPGRVGMFGAGNMIGFVSSLVGIGGGSLSVPFMIWCNIPVHRAIGTSAAIGLPIAVAGAFGYVFNGWNDPNLPDYALGYVYLPALFGIAAVSVLTAPLGVRLAHSLPVGRLKKIFALLLIVVGTRMLIGLL
jgi:uncharacterized membrane protein YfcA